MTAALNAAPLLLIPPIIQIVFLPEAAQAPGEGSPLAKLEQHLQSFAPLVANVFPGLLGPDGWLASGSADSASRASFLVVIGLAAVSIALLGAAAQFAFVQLSRSLSLRILADIRQDLAAHVVRLGMGYHTGSRKGDLLSRATNDVSVVLGALGILFDDLVLEPLQLAFKVVVCFFANATLTLLVGVFVPVLAIPLLLFGKRVRKGARRSLSALGESTEAMSQMFAGIRVVKAFRMEERELREFREVNDRWVSRALSVVRAKASTEAFLHAFTYGGFALLVVAFGLLNVRMGLFKDAGALAAWTAGFTTIYQHVRRSAKAYQTVQESLSASERLFEILDLEPAIPERAGGKPVQLPIASVEFGGVSFAYDGERVLDDVSLRIDAGQTIALVGPSGGGKSTLVDLVARFYDPQSGAIRVNGVDLRELDPEAWIRCWALVDQHPFLFHATIRENVAYGRPKATDAEIREALAAADLLGFVDSLPQGIDTEVGDRGARLSGGQRQRLTIARALLKDPAVLLLDEATSSLDSESESAVQRALERLMEGRTSIVVAHRLSTIRNADRIVVIERGRILEEGTHDDLLSRGGAYSRLYHAQAGANGSGK